MPRQPDSAQIDLAEVFLRIQHEMLAQLAVDQLFEHGSSQGAATEHHWRQLFARYLPQRYRADSVFVIDRHGRRSRQIDLAIFDPLSSPPLFPHSAGPHIPAESVYAIFEIKPAISKQWLRDAGEKAASVRALTGANPKLLSGLLAATSVWKHRNLPRQPHPSPPRPPPPAPHRHRLRPRPRLLRTPPNPPNLPTRRSPHLLRPPPPRPPALPRPRPPRENVRLLQATPPSGITVIPDALQLRSRQEPPAAGEPHRGIGFEEAQELFSRPYWLDRRSDVPEQFVAIGWVQDQLYSVMFEIREDAQGEVFHLVTLWKSTKQEVRLYEENS